MATKLTKVIANFESSLAGKLAQGATTGALSNVTDKNGVALPTGKYCMVVNRGTGDEEHLLFTLTGSAMTGIISISRQGVQTSGVQNANGHRVGVACYLTDFVNLLTIVNILNGVDTIDATTPLQYDANPTFTDSKQLVSKGYVDTATALAITNFLSGNNIFSGNNTFNGTSLFGGTATFNTPPKVPTPVAGNDAVDLATLLATAFGSAVFLNGFANFDIRRDSLGRIESIADNIALKTYFIKYRTDDIYVPWYIDTVDSFVVLDYNVDNDLTVGRKY